MTGAASFLNSFFSGYDGAILGMLHGLACGFLTFLFKLITLLGEKGILFFLAALVFMYFPKTRKLGVCLFGAVACGALITNIILKDAVARPRPFETVDLYRQYWQAVGSPAEDGFSFPSGHVTAAAAGCTAICLMEGKKWIAPSAVWVFLMMVARNYLMAHYPSDVLAALIIGVASGYIAWIITKFLYSKFRKLFLIPLPVPAFIQELPDKLPKLPKLPELPKLPKLPKISLGSVVKKNTYVGKHEKR